MRVAIHQPDLLPYSGFWFKMATSDAFVLAVHDQFQKHGYQRRVKMREKWCSHQLVAKPSLVPIEAVTVAEGWQQRLIDTIRGRYSDAKHFRTRGASLIEQISACSGATLPEVNGALIEVVRTNLGIATPILQTPPPTNAGVDRLIEQVHMVGGSSYLSGSGGRAYMGEEAETQFASAGITLEWSQHQHSTGDSIVSVLLDADNPMDVVLRQAPTESA